MTLRELIEKLEDIAVQNADNVVVLRDDNSGGCEAIHSIKVEDAIDVKTKKPTIAVVIGG